MEQFGRPKDAVYELYHDPDREKRHRVREHASHSACSPGYEKDGTLKTELFANYATYAMNYMKLHVHRFVPGSRYKFTEEDQREMIDQHADPCDMKVHDLLQSGDL